MKETDTVRSLSSMLAPSQESSHSEKSLNQLELMYIMMHRHSLSASLYMSQCMEEEDYLFVRMHNNFRTLFLSVIIKKNYVQYII